MRHIMYHRDNQVCYTLSHNYKLYLEITILRPTSIILILNTIILFYVFRRINMLILNVIIYRKYGYI